MNFGSLDKRQEGMLGLAATLCIGFGSAILLEQFRKPYRRAKQLENEVKTLEEKLEELSTRIDTMEETRPVPHRNGYTTPSNSTARLAEGATSKERSDPVEFERHHLMHSAVHFYGAYATLEQRSHVVGTVPRGGAPHSAPQPSKRRSSSSESAGSAGNASSGGYDVSPTGGSSDGDADEVEEAVGELQVLHNGNKQRPRRSSQPLASTPEARVSSPAFSDLARVDLSASLDSLPPPNLENLRRLAGHQKAKRGSSSLPPRSVTGGPTGGSRRTPTKAKH
mmetsp:Transcript_21488/g.49518  ORF Transcript_21488/g.49518 Transcript_21488/m.49518 type:complete len:280 (+) Transcript_21488:254-1093(+)